MNVVERQQKNWDLILFDKLNDTPLNYEVGDKVLIKFDPRNPSLSVLRPGHFGLWNLSKTDHRLQGTVVERKTYSTMTTDDAREALDLSNI